MLVNLNLRLELDLAALRSKLGLPPEAAIEEVFAAWLGEGTPVELRHVTITDWSQA